MRNFYHKLKYIIPVLAISFLWNGCNNIDQPIQVPTYVHVDSFSFVRTAGQGFGVTTHQITQVWAYYNNNPIGAFDLPCNIPVITSGASGALELDPGITVDGLNSLLSTYPFYELDTFTLLTQPGKVIVHEPRTQYYPTATTMSFSTPGNSGFYPYSDQGNANIFTMAPMGTTSVDSNTIDGVTSSDIIRLVAGTADSSVDSSKVAFPISYDGEPSYIELDYKSDVAITLGLQVNLDGVSAEPYYLAGIYPSATWQKFYLAVADFAGQYKGTSYNLYIKAVLPDTMSSGTVLLTNIQLVHF